MPHLTCKVLDNNNEYIDEISVVTDDVGDN